MHILELDNTGKAQWSSWVPSPHGELLGSQAKECPLEGSTVPHLLRELLDLQFTSRIAGPVKCESSPFLNTQRRRKDRCEVFLVQVASLEIGKIRSEAGL